MDPTPPSDPRRDRVGIPHEITASFSLEVTVLDPSPQVVAKQSVCATGFAPAMPGDFRQPPRPVMIVERDDPESIFGPGTETPIHGFDPEFHRVIEMSKHTVVETVDQCRILDLVQWIHERHCGEIFSAANRGRHRRRPRLETAADPIAHPPRDLRGLQVPRRANRSWEFSEVHDSLRGCRE